MVGFESLRGETDRSDLFGRILLNNAQMVLDKVLQKAISFDGNTMTAHITMTDDIIVPIKEKNQEPVAVACNMDVLSAIKTRQSIRKFTSELIC